MSPYFVLDLETGGLNHTLHPITEVGIIVLDSVSLKQIDFYQTYVKPYNNLVITKDALKHSNVSMRDIEKGKDYKIVLQDLVELSKKFAKSRRSKEKPIMVGHNIDKFDRKFLEDLFSLANKNMYDFYSHYMIDTIPEMKRMEGGMKEAVDYKYKLSFCCERMGIKLKSAHGAEADITANAELFRKITFRMRNNSGNTNIEEDTTSAERPKTRNFFQI